MLTADLVLTMEDFPDPVTVGGDLEYSLNVTNFGPHPATNVVLTDVLPPGVAFVSAQSTHGVVSHSGSEVRVEIGLLEATEFAQITIVVRPTAEGTIVTTASVTSGVNDPNPASNLADATTDVSPANQPPVADAGGPYTVAEGGSVTLSGAGSPDPDQSTDTLSFAWDLDNDGQFDDATGITPTFSAADLDGPATRTVGLLVTDAAGASSTDSATVEITSVAPTAAIAGPTSGSAGQSLSFSLTATDPAPADAAASFSFDIDWGDGLTEQASGLSGLSVPHAFSSGGSFTIRVSATDKDGGTGSEATHSVVIATQPVVFDGSTLAITGTDANDLIQVVRINAANQLRVLLNGVAFGPFEPARIIIHARGGNDTATLHGFRSTRSILPVTAQITFFGGEGNDTFEGGHGTAANLLLGEAGADNLRAGQGRDILIGGLGADRLDGNTGDDIVIGGTTSHDGELKALDALLAEWSSRLPYRDRVGRLKGLGAGLSSLTVFDDAAIDTLLGGSGDDWFFAVFTGTAKDALRDRSLAREFVTVPGRRPV